MKDVNIHTNALIKVALLLTLEIISFPSNGQDTTTVPIEIESVINEADLQEEVIDRFETVTNEDLLPVAHRKVDTSRVFKLKEEEEFWYINEAPPKKTVESSKINKALVKDKDPIWLRNLLWFLVVGGFISILIWFLLFSNVQLFRRPPPVINHIIADEELTTENIFDINYDESIKSAIAVRDYRLAIRLLYLQTLKEMTVRNLIRYKQDRTNNDYLLQLFQTTYYTDFFRLTRHFEYAWYGKFPVSSEAFATIQKEFASFKQTISL